jgi:flagella basal body P-ring formation protein FlgA
MAKSWTCASIRRAPRRWRSLRDLLSFEVETVSEQGEIETIPVVAEVAVKEDVVVARRSINRGEKVSTRHLKLEARRFTDVRSMGLTDLAAAVGQRSRRLIRVGEMLQPAALETEPFVFRGQAVTVWVRQGALVIRASGRAQQDGRLGDTIDVRRDGSERQAEIFEAVVTGPGTVSMGPGGAVAGDWRVDHQTALRD